MARLVGVDLPREKRVESRDWLLKAALAGYDTAQYDMAVWLINGVAGEVYFWAEDGRILLPWGPTPISRPNEIRLPRPCNVWATALDDSAVFARVTPGEKVSLVVEPKIREAGNG